ncbi:MAG: hypothetical protein ACJAWV_002550 [Flammeovirgaceae bacterium]|jgi:hypothetical protein
MKRILAFVMISGMLSFVACSQNEVAAPKKGNISHSE